MLITTHRFARMNISKIALGVSAVALMAAPAMAQDSGLYGTIGAKTIEFDAYSVEGRIGYNVNPLISIEGQGSIGVSGEEQFGVETQEDYSLGVFVRASAPLGERFSVFGRVGYQLSEFGVEGNGIDVSEDFDGIGYGGGVEFMLGEYSGIRAEYTAVDYGDENGVNVGTADTVSVAFVRKF